MFREDFRKDLIKAMCASGLLKNNELGKGWTDWHTDEDCGVTFVMKNGQEFDVVVSAHR